MIPDFEACYGAVSSRDPRFDGWFVTAVTSTGIYCRPSCPARTPKPENVRFFATAAAAQSAGFRACKRCRPDASPGSPEWRIRTDLVGRAMRLIADGVVDREGVAGLARRLHLSERQVHRELVAEVGAGPQALARAQRAQAARVLIETSLMPFSEIAFSSGFASIRQFNDTIRAVFATTPTELRRNRKTAEPSPPGSIALRLARREPFDAGVLTFLGPRSASGIESFDGITYRRTLELPHSAGIVELTPGDDHVRCVLHLEDVRDLAAAVQRCRRLLDLDSDPVAIDASLSRDRKLRALVKAVPGIRVPGSVDGFEMAVRAVIGQQISVAGARTLVGRLVESVGKPLTMSDGSLTHLFPSSDVMAEADLEQLGMPGARKRTLRELARAVASGDIALDGGADRGETTVKLLAIPGIGPWTASYVELRALGDPDVFLVGDLGVRKALQNLGYSANETGERWRPWRSYALMHVWRSLD